MRLLKRAGLFRAGPGAIQVKRAVGLDDFLQAYALVHEQFVHSGFIRAHPSGLRIRRYEALPDTATFVGSVDGRVVGVTTIVPDSAEFGLPTDKVFREEIDPLRAAGRELCEGTNWVVADEYRNTSVFTELTRCCFAHAEFSGSRDLLATVSPGHAAFYRLMGFEQMGDLRSYSEEAHDPVVLMRLDLDTIAPRAMAAETGSREDDAFFKGYYLDGNPYRQKVAAWAAAAGRASTDVELLRQLFVTRTGFLEECSLGEREVIRQCWGDELFNQVMGRSVATIGAGQAWGNG